MIGRLFAVALSFGTVTLAFRILSVVTALLASRVAPTAPRPMAPAPPGAQPWIDLDRRGLPGGDGLKGDAVVVSLGRDVVERRVLVIVIPDRIPDIDTCAAVGLDGEFRDEGPVLTTVFPVASSSVRAIPVRLPMRTGSPLFGLSGLVQVRFRDQPGSYLMFVAISDHAPLTAAFASASVMPSRINPATSSLSVSSSVLVCPAGAPAPIPETLPAPRFARYSASLLMAASIFAA